jgi:hypothetical protein
MAGDDCTGEEVGNVQTKAPLDALKQKTSCFPDPIKAKPSIAIGEERTSPPTIDIQTGIPVVMFTQ